MKSENKYNDNNFMNGECSVEENNKIINNNSNSNNQILNNTV